MTNCTHSEAVAVLKGTKDVAELQVSREVLVVLPNDVSQEEVAAQEEVTAQEEVAAQEGQHQGVC